MKPNIVFLMTDQQRYDSLGCYGCEAVSTPNIDQLALEGALFENCYVNNPLCLPSRASIFTGKTLPGHGDYSLRDILPDNQLFLSKRLKDTGYQTALFGKLHVSANEDTHKHVNHGFDTYELFTDPRKIHKGVRCSYSKWLEKSHPDVYKAILADKRGIEPIPEEAHYTRWISQSASEYIKNRDEDKPFFCFVSTPDPHNPYTNHPDCALIGVDKEKIPEPVGFKNWMDEKYIRDQIDDGNIQNYKYDNDICKMRQEYLANIVFTDREYGSIIDTLRQEGILENTIIVFTSDHGDMLGDHGLFVKGAFFYEACVKVPLIMRFPRKIKAGVRTGAFVQPHDITSTLLMEAGYTNEELMETMPESFNLIPYLSGALEWSRFRDHAVCIYRESGTKGQEIMLMRYLKERFDVRDTILPIHATMLRRGRYKLSVYHGLERSASCPHGELYDMEQDPDELQDLWFVPCYEGIKADMLLQITNWLVRTDILYRQKI